MEPSGGKKKRSFNIPDIVPAGGALEAPGQESSRTVSSITR